MLKKRCFREPIPKIFDAARYLDAAVSAHINGKTNLADELFIAANDPEIWAWTDSVWGKRSLYVTVNKISKEISVERVPSRMPTATQKLELHKRDGYHCRYCGIPVIRSEVRKKLRSIYPQTVVWGKTNASQHAAFQCMWAQYDHVVPHSDGGTNEIENLVVSCAACNFGKMEYSLDELGLIDPRSHPAVSSQWDGLERLMAHRASS